MSKDVEELLNRYQSKKEGIEKRLKEFENMLNESDERVFAELVFCLCTPQSKATICWNVVSSLMKNNLLCSGTENQINPFLNVVRFGDRKASYIVKVRELFSKNGKINIKERIRQFDNIFELRGWLTENVVGMGMKEASHFLRNIGIGDNLAILDRHVLKNLKKYNVIKEIPEALTKRRYLEIEDKMWEFSKQIGIPLSELDLLFWSEETGMIFK